MAIDVSGPIAASIATRARLARPAAVAVAAGSSLVTAAWVAALLGWLLGSTTRGERLLLGIIATAALAGVALVHARALRTSWESIPAISGYIARFTRGVLGAVATFGALELLRIGWLSVVHSDLVSPGIRLVLTALAAVLGLGWQRWRLPARLGPKIG
jgi:hypothetical protein